MDKLPPPPKGSPEEIQAWNNMMDTMVTFIKASTHLMNTITDKVRNKGTSGATSKPTPIENCEPECEVCQPKPPCGICGKAKPTTPPVAATPVPPAETAVEEAPETPPDPPPPEDAPPAEDAEPPADQTEAEAPAEAPPADAETVQTPQPPAASEGQCVCSTIRAQRLAAEKKDRCSCSKKSKNLSDVSEESQSEAPDLEVEIMCGCGATPGNTEAMMKDMMGKLANAQEEINQLQEELAKLQRMDASKRTGPHAGPNPAALYREIMKDTSGMNRGPYDPVCLPCGDDSARSSPGSYMGTPDMTMSSRPMRQLQVPQFAPGRSTPFYAAPQPPCRRPGQRYMGQSPEPTPQMTPLYGRSPQEYNDSNPEYWSRLAAYSPSPNSQVQRIMCPSIRASPPETPQPPKRTIICSPPPRPSGPNSCNSNSCRIQDPNMS